LWFGFQKIRGDLGLGDRTRAKKRWALYQQESKDLLAVLGGRGSCLTGVDVLMYVLQFVVGDDQ